MTSRDFCYFLQGYLETKEDGPIPEKTVKIIQNHLAMVFIHEIDPSMGDKKEQEKLNAAHHLVNSDMKMRC